VSDVTAMMLRSYLNLGSWLGAHITVFRGLFLGLRTDLEGTLAMIFHVVSSTVSFGLSYSYKDIHFRITGLPVLGGYL